MLTNTDDEALILDQERCNRIQEIMELLEQLMKEENRRDPDYVQLRYEVLEGYEHLYKASIIYLEKIEKGKSG